MPTMKPRGLRGLISGRVRRLVPRAAVTLLGLTLVAFLFEGAVHSVHHLDSDSEATGCWVASAAGCLSIVSPAAVVLEHLRPVAPGSVVDVAPANPALRPLGVSRGRAPPSAPSA